MVSLKAMAAVGVFCCAAGALAQTQPAVHHEANFEAERKQANELYLQGNRLQALPLYEDLCKQDPTVAVFAERHGSGLAAAADIESDPTKQATLHQQSMAEFRRAKALGDDSPLVETALGMDEDFKRADAAKQSGNAAGPVGKNPLSDNPQALEWMQKGEVAFAKNDSATAFEDYKKAAEIDPTSYMATLYTGDACFRGHDFACAEDWFAKAAALDPYRETAYRYWGDALFQSGHSSEARTKYEQAIVAEPYVRLSWGGLAQWGTKTKTTIGSPPIHRATITSDGGGVKLTLPQGPTGDAGGWAFYGACRVGAESKRAPGMRRTAEEETDCLNKAADYVAKSLESGKMKDADLSDGMKALLALHRDGLVESWVLLNGADQDVLKDYVAYRAMHRDLLMTYLDKYVVHNDMGFAASASKLQIQR